MDDAYVAYKWLLDEELLPAERIFIIGVSVGGGLALALIHRIRKENLPQPKCALCISPWTDLTLSNNSYKTNRENDSFFNFTNLENAAKLYIGKDSAKNPEISPIFGDFRGFPPIFLQVASTEMLLDDSLIIAERMKEQGVSVTIDVWDGLFHDFPIFCPEKMTVEQAHPHLEGLFPPETYYAAHLNIIRLGREICTARKAMWEKCPIRKLCDYGKSVTGDPVSRAV